MLSLPGGVEEGGNQYCHPSTFPVFLALMFFLPCCRSFILLSPISLYSSFSSRALKALPHSPPHSLDHSRPLTYCSAIHTLTLATSRLLDDRTPTCVSTLDKSKSNVFSFSVYPLYTYRFLCIRIYLASQFCTFFTIDRRASSRLYRICVRCTMYN